MLEYAPLVQFVWQELQNAGSEMTTVIWEKFKEQMAETAVSKFQTMFENKQENEFKQELATALERNKNLTEQLQELQKTKPDTSISVIKNYFNNTTIDNNGAGSIVIGSNIIRNNKG